MKQKFEAENNSVLLKQYSVLLNSLQHLLFSWVLLICQRLQAGNQKLMFLLLKDNLVNHNLCYS